ncbi:hypothetical protein DL771_000004 [Monosporascus sp. 5C6A]|nr:hypothetical protein DL771_000004 [Monosporascus sp. 5C6A]
MDWLTRRPRTGRTHHPVLADHPYVVLELLNSSTTDLPIDSPGCLIRDLDSDGRHRNDDAQAIGFLCGDASSQDDIDNGFSSLAILCFYVRHPVLNLRVLPVPIPDGQPDAGDDLWLAGLHDVLASPSLANGDISDTPLDVHDFAGSGPVHIASRFGALARSLMLGPRITENTVGERGGAIHLKPCNPFKCTIYEWRLFNSTPNTPYKLPAARLDSGMNDRRGRSSSAAADLRGLVVRGPVHPASSSIGSPARTCA